MGVEPAWIDESGGERRFAGVSRRNAFSGHSLTGCRLVGTGFHPVLRRQASVAIMQRLQSSLPFILTGDSQPMQVGHRWAVRRIGD